MITPLFKLGQDDRFLIVTIRAPHCKIRDAELSYDDDTFLFHSKPYFLRLFLPAQVVDNETGTCDYDTDKGIFTVKVPKKNPGEYFTKLDMLSEFLKPQQNQPSAQQPVEIIPPVQKKGNGSADSDEERENEEKGEEEKENGDERRVPDEELYAKQELPGDYGLLLANEKELCAKFGYGFGWTRHGHLGRFGDDIGELIDLADAENVPIEDRSERLKEFDERHFREQYYLADLFSPEQLQLDAMEFYLVDRDHLELSEEDLTDLKDLKIRQLEQFDPKVTEQITFSLVDLLFAFHYDLRTTLGEHNVESGWTISKLAPSLTFLVRWHSVREAILASVRHSLVLPLIRNWELAMKVLKDVQKTILSRSAILHCLLTVRRIFNRGGEFRYLFNQLYLDDLCLWIQSVSDELLSKLAGQFGQELGIRKMDLLELDLDFIEAQARLELLKPLDSDDDSEPAGLCD